MSMPAGVSIAELLSDDAFWARDSATIADEPLPELERMILRYYKAALIQEEASIGLLEKATEAAERKVRTLTEKKIYAAIEELREAASPSYYDIALGMALSGLGGAVAAGALKIVLGRVLKNRLLMVTTVSKVRLPNDAAHAGNLKQLQAFAAKHGRKVETKANFHKMTSQAVSVNLNPNSWESFLLEYGPKIVDMVADAGVTKGLQEKFQESTGDPPVKDVADFFSKRGAELGGQLNAVRESHEALTGLIVRILKLNPDARHQMIATIKEIREFDAEPVSDWWKAINILDQPIFATAVSKAFFIPHEILPYRGATHTYIYPNHVTVRHARPRQAKASAAERRTLLEVSKELWNPLDLEKNKFVSLFDKYGGEPHRAEIEVVNYFNRARLGSIAPKIDAIIKYMNDHYNEPYGPGHPK